MSQPSTALTKADTVALWHAVEAMSDFVCAMRGENFKEFLEAERARLTAARRALRKVNAIRKAQEQHKPAGGVTHDG